MAIADALYDAGRAAHPDLALERAAFAGALARRAAAGIEVVGGAIPGDLYLAVACELGDATALATLERTHLAELARLLRRVERDRAVVDEVVQRVRVRVLVGDGEAPPRIATYGGRGSLLGWLKVVGTRLHANLHRDARRRPDRADGDDADVEPPAVLPEPDQLLLGGLAPIVSQAIRQALRALPARERALLRLVYVSGATLDRVGVMYGVHKATVSRWIAAARERVLGDALAAARARTDLPADVLADACAQLASKLELGLSALSSTIDGAAAFAPD